MNRANQYCGIDTTTTTTTTGFGDPTFIVDNNLFTSVNCHNNNNYYPAVNRFHRHHQTMEHNSYQRYLQDFNEYIAQQQQQNDEPLQNRQRQYQQQYQYQQQQYHHDSLTNVERSPIRTFDRAQSARNYIPPRPPPTAPTRNYTTATATATDTTTTNNNNNIVGIQCTVDDYDITTTTTSSTANTMMLMMKNGSITPASKRARSVSAPHIHIPSKLLLSDNDEDNDDDDILDYLDIEVEDQNNDDTANASSKIPRSDSYVSISQTQDDVYDEYNNNVNYIKPTSSIPPSLPLTTSKTTTTTPEATSYIPGAYPFFDYIDYSREVDMTPDVPLTAMGRVPTFPAKLHAILLRKELHHIVSWLPHGRSWKVHDTTEFEKQVIAIYFEFTKHPNSSFFRQAKLWGFLRIKRNNCIDHDSYYHPKFLRGLPYLCKDVRRPSASHLPDIPPIDQEPDFTAISKIYPLPSNSNAIKIDPTVHLDWFMKGKQQQQHRNDTHHVQHPPPPNQERMTKKTSSSTSTSTSYGDYSSTTTTNNNSVVVVKRKRSTPQTSCTTTDDSIQLQVQQQSIKQVSDHCHYNNDHIDRVQQPVIDINIPNVNTANVANDNDNVNINIDIDDEIDDERIDDDLGLNLDPYFTKGYHLYPFYNYVDHSTKHDMYPLHSYTEIGHLPTIPILLHAILLSSSSQFNKSSTTEIPTIMWQPHGRAFKICSPNKFESQILPQFGRFISGSSHNNNNNTIQIFLRHLLRWGFKRIVQTKSYDYDCYYHPKFLRGLPHLCKDWTMNHNTSSSSTSSNIISSSTLSSTDNIDDTTNNTNNNDTDEYPEPDFNKISQLYPIPEYDPNLTVEDLLGL